MLTTDQINKLWELVHPIKNVMLVTQENESLQARPMHLVQSNFYGKFYFFTDIKSEKVFEIENHNQVNLSFCNPSEQVYVSISGIAQLTKDQNLIEELWNPFVSAWFPQGKQDPAVGLIEVTCYKAEYWLGDNKIIQLFNYAKSILTKNGKPELGKNEKI